MALIQKSTEELKLKFSYSGVAPAGWIDTDDFIITLNNPALDDTPAADLIANWKAAAEKVGAITKMDGSGQVVGGLAFDGVTDAYTITKTTTTFIKNGEDLA